MANDEYYKLTIQSQGQEKSIVFRLMNMSKGQSRENIIMQFPYVKNPQVLDSITTTTTITLSGEIDIGNNTPYSTRDEAYNDLNEIFIDETIDYVILEHCNSNGGIVAGVGVLDGNNYFLKSIDMNLAINSLFEIPLTIQLGIKSDEL